MQKTGEREHRRWLDRIARPGQFIPEMLRHRSGRRDEKRSWNRTKPLQCRGGFSGCGRARKEELQISTIRRATKFDSRSTTYSIVVSAEFLAGRPAILG